MEVDQRTALERLIRAHGADCASLSRLIGRNPAYIQQFIRRGTPRRLAEADRATLARYFGIAEAQLGGPPAIDEPALTLPPRIDAEASAGPGGFAEDRAIAGGVGFSDAWLRRLAPRGGAGALSMIAVSGTSMLPTLGPGDEILVDTGDGRDRLRDGIYALRIGETLHVKRLIGDRDGFIIVSDNPRADPVFVDDPEAAIVIGRVVWVGRRL